LRGNENCSKSPASPRHCPEGGRGAVEAPLSHHGPILEGCLFRQKELLRRPLLRIPLLIRFDATSPSLLTSITAKPPSWMRCSIRAASFAPTNAWLSAPWTATSS